MASETRALQPTSMAISQKSDFVKRGKSPFFPLDFDPYDVSPDEIPVPNVLQMYLEREKQKDILKDKERQAFASAGIYWFDSNDGLPFPAFLVISGLCCIKCDDLDGSWEYQSYYQGLGIPYIKVDNELIIYDPADPDPTSSECLGEYLAKAFVASYVEISAKNPSEIKQIISDLNDGSYLVSKAYLLRMADYNVDQPVDQSVEQPVEELAFGSSDEQFPIVHYGYLAYLDGRAFYVPNGMRISANQSHVYQQEDGGQFRVFVIVPTIAFSQFVVEIVCPARPLSTYNTFQDYPPITSDEIKTLISKVGMGKMVFPLHPNNDWREGFELFGKNNGRLEGIDLRNILGVSGSGF